MPFDVTVKINKRFKVKSPLSTVFKLLADVPESASHFPKVKKLVDMGDNTYRWEMEKIGLDKYYIQTVYACQYTSNKKQGTVKWEAVEDVGNALVSGKWTLKSVDPKHTQCSLTTTGVMTVPLPALTKFLLAGLVENEFQGLVDQYVENLKDVLNG